MRYVCCGCAAYGLPNVYQSATVWEQYLVSVYWCALRLCHDTRIHLGLNLSALSWPQVYAVQLSSLR